MLSINLHEDHFFHIFGKIIVLFSTPLKKSSQPPTNLSLINISGIVFQLCFADYICLLFLPSTVCESIH
jgi:hypothetical protein